MSLYARRSRLKAVTYSTCCQSVSSVCRLPTFTVPDTAPTPGSANQRTSRATACRSSWVSASMATTTSPLAARSPWLRADHFPPFAWRITRTPRASAMLAVASVEPSSTTITSRSAPTWPSRESSVRPMTAASL